MIYIASIGVGMLSLAGYCIINYNTHPLILMGIIPIATTAAIPGGYILSKLSSNITISSNPKHNIMIIIFSSIIGATITGLGTFLGLAKYFSDI